jgi:hypothetical protein
MRLSNSTQQLPAGPDTQAVKALLQHMILAALQRRSKAFTGTSWTLQVEKVQWAAEQPAAATPAARHLMDAEAEHAAASARQPLTAMAIPHTSPEQQSCNNPHIGWLLSVPGFCIDGSQENADRGHERKLLATDAQAWRAAHVEATLAGWHSNRLLHGGLTSLGAELAVGLKALAASETVVAAGSSNSLQAQLLRVMFVERSGVCGNGICEVGERTMANSEGLALYTGNCDKVCTAKRMA